MNLDADEARKRWVKRIAQTNLGREATEEECAMLGIVPWHEGWRLGYEMGATKVLKDVTLSSLVP